MSEKRLIETQNCGASFLLSVSWVDKDFFLSRLERSESKLLHAKELSRQNESIPKTVLL